MADQLISWEFKPQIYPFTKGIDKEIFNLGDATLFKDLPKPIALYVGRLAIEKNIEDFLNKNQHVFFSIYYQYFEPMLLNVKNYL